MIEVLVAAVAALAVVAARRYRALRGPRVAATPVRRAGRTRGWHVASWRPGLPPALALLAVVGIHAVTHTHLTAAEGGQLDHGTALAGLGDDDHTQYLLRTQTAPVKAIAFSTAGTWYAYKNTGELVTSGADPDTVIQAAINALSAGRTMKETVVVIGAATLDVGLSVPSYTVLDLSRAKFTAGASVNVITNSTPAAGNTDIEVIGGSIDGAGATYANSRCIYWDGVSDVLVRDTYAKDAGLGCIVTVSATVTSARVTLSNVRAEGSKASHGVQFSNTTDPALVGSRMASNWHQGVYIYRCDRPRVDYNTFYQNGQSNNGSGGGVGIVGENVGRQASVVGNVVDGGNKNAGSIEVASTHDSVIVGNTLYNITVGISVGSNSNRSTVSGNTIECGANPQGAGLTVTSSPDSTVSGNLVVGAIGQGLVVQLSSRTTVVGNIVKNTKQTGLAEADGISLDRSDNCAVVGNFSGDDQGGAATQKYGIIEEGTSDGNTIVANVLQGNLTSALQITGASTRALMNRGATASERVQLSASPTASGEIGATGGDLYVHDGTAARKVQDAADKAVANGIASLDADARVPAAQTPTAPTCDTISERTAGAGVTPDGVRLKDGMVKVAGTPTESGEVGYASNRLKLHDGTAVRTVRDDAGFSHVQNAAFPGFGAGNAVTVPSTVQGSRVVVQSFNVTSGAVVAGWGAINVETGVGTGVYVEEARVEVPGGVTGTFILTLMARVPAGRRYYFTEEGSADTTVTSYRYNYEDP